MFLVTPAEVIRKIEKKKRRAKGIRKKRGGEHRNKDTVNNEY